MVSDVFALLQIAIKRVQFASKMGFFLSIMFASL
jgi:hypothetical protein